MQTTRTSENDPLRIAAVTPGNGQGRIGITLCPGKTDPAAMMGPVARDLPTDLDAIRDWGATAVVSLVTDREIDYLGVSDLEKEVLDRHMEWWHAPIPDGEPPDPTFERAWAVAGEVIRDRLRLGFDVLVHCKGGLGRAGTVAARLLVELGGDPDDAIRRVRGARSPHAVENRRQEAHVECCTPREAANPPRTADSVRGRALGVFLGLAVGDAVGTRSKSATRARTKRTGDAVCRARRRAARPRGTPAHAGVAPSGVTRRRRSRAHAHARVTPLRNGGADADRDSPRTRVTQA